jgi:hypothetical protein
MCYVWDGKVDYEGYLKLAGDVFVKLGQWVHRCHMNELSCLELCSQVAGLMNEIQELLFLGFYDERLMRLVVPVLKRFVEGEYPQEDYDFELSNLMRFVGELQEVLMRLHPLAHQINREREEEERKSAFLSSSGSSGSDELPF